MLRSVSFSFAFILFSTSFVFGQRNIFQEEKKILDQILGRDYDPRIRPQMKENNSTNTTGTLVSTNIYLRDIEYISTEKMEWKIQITLRQKWNDERLAFDDLKGHINYLILNDIKRIWTTDLFFSNSRSSQSHGVIHPDSLIRIYPNGNVLFSTRLTLTLTCPMDLTHYPFDEQTCSIKIASYGFTTDEIVYLWKEGEYPIEVTRTLNLPGVTLEKFSTNYCTSTTKTGEYSCLKADFTFKRVLSSYISNWIVPTAIITFASFVSFWLRLDKSARIITLVVTLLLLYLHILLIKYKSPNVSFSTPMDCWTSTCLIFIIAAIIEYGIVKCVVGRNKCHNNRSDSSNDSKKSNGKNCEEGDAVALKPLVDDGHENNIEEGGKEYTVNEVSNRRNYLQKWRRAPITCRIDSIAGIVFPLLFILYIISFFGYELMITTSRD